MRLEDLKERYKRLRGHAELQIEFHSKGVGPPPSELLLREVERAKRELADALAARRKGREVESEKAASTRATCREALRRLRW